MRAYVVKVNDYVVKMTGNVVILLRSRNNVVKMKAKVVKISDYVVKTDIKVVILVQELVKALKLKLTE